MGKEIGRSYKYNRSKISTPTLKKPVLSSSAAHTSSSSNPIPKSISSQCDNKDNTTNQNKNNTSHIYDIHSVIQNIVLYNKNIIKTITKIILSWCKMKWYVDFQWRGGGLLWWSIGWWWGVVEWGGILKTYCFMPDFKLVPKFKYSILLS